MVARTTATAQERISVADRWLLMGLAGRLGWTNRRILSAISDLGKIAVERCCAARGRAGWTSTDHAERTGAPAKTTGARVGAVCRTLRKNRFAARRKLACRAL